MTDPRLDRLRQLDAAATPAPWVLWDRFATGGPVSAGSFVVLGDTREEPAEHVYTEADAEWIATARRMLAPTIELLETVLGHAGDQCSVCADAALAVLDQVGGDDA